MPSMDQTQVTAIGGRAGWAASADGRFRVELARPGDGDDRRADAGAAGTNPEQLFGAAYAACFLSAIRKVAEREGVTIAPDANVTAKVALRPDAEPDPPEGGLPEGGLPEVGLPEVGLDVTLVVDLPDVEGDMAQRMAAQAHEMCPYSRAIRGNVAVRIVVI